MTGSLGRGGKAVKGLLFFVGGMGVATFFLFYQERYGGAGHGWMRTAGLRPEEPYIGMLVSWARGFTGATSEVREVSILFMLRVVD